MIPRRNSVQIVTPAPIMLYSNGFNRGRGLAGGAFTSFVGFYADQGQDPAFDEACKAAKINEMEIQHTRPGQPSAAVRSWYFGEVFQLYPLTAGPVAATIAASLVNGNAKRTAEAGIGVRWAAGERSKAAIRGMVPALIDQGHTGIVQLSVRSHMTDRLLAALAEHTRVAEAADLIVDRAKHPAEVGPWELIMALGPGQEETWGKGDTASVTPFTGMHPAPDRVDSAYIRGLFLGMKSPARAAMVEAWPSTQAWAAEYAAGNAGDQLGAEE